MARQTQRAWSALFCALAISASAANGPTNYYEVTRPCRFSEWNVRRHWGFDHILRTQIPVRLLEKWETSTLPLVLIDVDGTKIPGFMDRRCLMEGALTQFEFDALNPQPKFFTDLISPSLQDVIKGKGDLRVLAMGPAPLTEGALKRIQELREKSRKIEVDWGALREISRREEAKERWESLAAFLSSSKIELGDLITFSALEAEDLKTISKIAGDALLLSFAESSAKNPRCDWIGSGIRLFFVTGLKVETPEQVLAIYSLAYGEASEGDTSCAAERSEARLLLGQLDYPKPASPYQEDQKWKRTWGVMTDEQIQAAFPATRVRVVRDDGDVASEKRIIAEVPLFGTLEEYKSWGHVEYRWIHTLNINKYSVKSTSDLRSKMKRKI